MADASFEILEIRMLLREQTPHLYIRCSPDSDGGVLVGGWYHKEVPSAASALDLLSDALSSGDYLMWAREAPSDGERFATAAEAIMETVAVIRTLVAMLGAMDADVVKAGVDLQLRRLEQLGGIA